MIAPHAATATLLNMNASSDVMHVKRARSMPGGSIDDAPVPARW
jgi:hypothetical protein